MSFPWLRYIYICCLLRLEVDVYISIIGRWTALFLSISVCVRSLLFEGVHKIIKINYCFCDRENNMCRCGFVRLGVYKYKHSAVRFEQCFKNKTADLVCNDGYFDLRSTICSLECISVCVYLCRPSWLL